MFSNQDLGNLRFLDGKVYENLLISELSVGIAGTVVHTQELNKDTDNSVTTIIEEMSTHQIAINTNIQIVNDGINALLQKMATWWVVVHARM